MTARGGDRKDTEDGWEGPSSSPYRMLLRPRATDANIAAHCVQVILAGSTSMLVVLYE